VRVCAQAVADYLKQSGLASRGLVIGYDTRFASEDFASAAAEVVAGNRIKVYLCPRATPTPVISYGTLVQKAGGAIIITASHNPAQWNGFKYKSETGSSATSEVTAEIEKHVTRILESGKINQVSLSQAEKQGLIEYRDLAPVYFQQVARLVNLNELRRARLKIVVDSMFGAGSGFLRKLLDGGNIEIVEINSERNPLFPGMERPEPIAVNLRALLKAVTRRKASVGLAMDGDADRMGIVDEKGVFLTQLQVFALLCLYLLEVRGERGAIVKAITTTSMVYRLGEIFGVPVFETPVGFKYVAPKMEAENALIGGEESGGYGFRGHVLERDGILANLYFLDFMVKTGKTPSQLLEHLYSKVGTHYYQRQDLEFREEERERVIGRIKDRPLKYIGGVRVAKSDTTDGFRFILADDSWLLIRFSGTEPVLRIYTEASTVARAGKLIGLGRELVGV
jgi:alpha-D-glucose phosphate-specific phosphoglucomutase